MARITLSPKPSVIGAKLVKRAAEAQAAVEAQAKVHAARGQAAMQQTGLYQDRTGHLRSSTFGEAEETTITLGAGAEYAPYVVLGTSRMAARDFITPVVSETAANYVQDAAKAIKDALG